MASPSGAQIQSTLVKFARSWEKYRGTERAEAQTFLNELFAAYGQDRREAGAPVPHRRQPGRAAAWPGGSVPMSPWGEISHRGGSRHPRPAVRPRSAGWSGTRSPSGRHQQATDQPRRRAHQAVEGPTEPPPRVHAKIDLLLRADKCTACALGLQFTGTTLRVE